MINQIQTSCSRIQLCSRCTHTEITGWLNDNWNILNDEIKKQIIQELKMIKLKPGLCIVCKNTLVSDGTTGKIHSILKESKVEDNIVKEFENYFCQE